jgi:hypothetical protein
LTKGRVKAHFHRDIASPYRNNNKVLHSVKDISTYTDQIF